MPDCPVCGNPLPEGRLLQVGLDTTQLDKIRDKLESQELAVILDLGKIALKYLHPDRLGAEFQVHEALESLSQRSGEIMQKQLDLIEKMREGERMDKKEILEQYQKELVKVNKDFQDVQQKYVEALSQLTKDLSLVREKLAGTGIGKPGEMVTIREMKSAFPTDSFTSRQATRGGADIVAEVKDGRITAGTIVISVKYEDNWKGDFVTQLKKNLRQENTDYGILVSRTFPSDALSDTVYLTEEGNAVVKPEYATLAYMGMREAVIHLYKVSSHLKEQEDRAKVQERVSSAIRDWLSGENFRKAVQDLDLAVQASKDTDILVQQWQNYADEKSAKVQKVQQQLRGYLIACSSLLTDLQSRLGKTEATDNMDSWEQRAKVQT